MNDIENQSPHSGGYTMSLRQRRNIKSSPQESPLLDTEARKRYLHQHSKLVKEVNSATGNEDEDDEEAREMKKMIMDYQLKNNNEMGNCLFKTLVGVLIVLIIIYGIVIFHKPSDEPSIMDILVNAFRILLGMRGDQFFLSSSHRIVASTAVSRMTLDKYVYPAWPWQWGSSSKSNRYLVPSSGSMPMKHILHETMKMKHERNIDIDIFHGEAMREFLVEYGHECNEEQNSMSILQKFDELNDSKYMDEKGSTGNGPKNLWLWCMIYSGNAFGNLDIDNYIIDMTPNILRKISLGSKPWGIENVIIDPNVKFDVDVNANAVVDVERPKSLLSLSTSILFVSARGSRVAKGMLQFILSRHLYDEEALTEELLRLIEKERNLKEGGENWTLLNAHCTASSTDMFDGRKLALVCSKQSGEENVTKQMCCYLVL